MAQFPLRFTSLRPASLQPRRPSLAWAVAVLCCAGLGAGCQQKSRFAEGTAAPARAPYASDQRSVLAAPESEFVLPPLKDIPAMPTQASPPLAGRLPGAWSPRAQVRPWKWIVIHHSATPDGGAARFDEEHRANGWDELGYHFVIGNGSDTRDGQIEVGPRWLKQKHGAHAKTPDNRFNDYGIGICLVGDFDHGRPSEAQMKSLATLVAYLMQRHRIPPGQVIGHDQTGKSTACPGHNLENQLALIRNSASRAVAQGFAAPDAARAGTAYYAVDGSKRE